MHLQSAWVRTECLASRKIEGVFKGIAQTPSSETPSWHSLQPRYVTKEAKKNSYKLADAGGLYLLVDRQEWSIHRSTDNGASTMHLKASSRRWPSGYSQMSALLMPMRNETPLERFLLRVMIPLSAAIVKSATQSGLLAKPSRRLPRSGWLAWSLEAGPRKR